MISERKRSAAQINPPIAIIGIACIFPGAHDRKTYWANIRNGVDSITEIPESHWSVRDFFNADPKKPDHTYGVQWQNVYVIFHASQL